MPRLAPLLLLLVVLVAAPATARASDNPAQLAQAVADEVVHIDPRAKGRVSPAEAGRLRLQITREALGRIKVLVVPPAAAERNGGVATLANRVMREAKVRGALIVVAGDEVRVGTTYDSGPAVAAVQAALSGRPRKRIAGDLAEAIDGVAAVDPGPSAERGGAPSPSPGGAGDDLGFGNFLDDLGTTLRIVLFAVGGVIVVVLLTPLVVYARRSRRRSAEGAEDLAADCAAARDELIAIGELLRELDIDPDMPGVDPAGRVALEQAVDLYGRADHQLARATTRRRLDTARETLRSARLQAETARARLGEPASGVPLTE